MNINQSLAHIPYGHPYSVRRVASPPSTQPRDRGSPQKQYATQSRDAAFTQSWAASYGASNLGTGITEQRQQTPGSSYAPTVTHSTPSSYTAEFYGGEDPPQSLGYGAMSVTSSMVGHPQSLQAASTIQSALHNLNSSQQLGIAPQLMAAAPALPVQSLNKENRENSRGADAKTPHSASRGSTDAMSGASSNFYLAPGSANHGGSYRQTLNPSIYNAYRLSVGQSPTRNSTCTPVVANRAKSTSPVVHVIAETVYRVPNGVAGAMGAIRKQDRFDKTALYKTELCTNWMLTGACTYGNKCHFAHGVDDLKPRMRVENYKTQPCCDPAREGCRRCMYGRRCNYCHPGEAIRRPHPTPYYDKDYYNALRRDFGRDNDYPFGIYV